ncbi:MAG: PaaI family thioesterase [Pseudomonadota bacterium]
MRDINRLNEKLPEFMHMLGGKITKIDLEATGVIVSFDVGPAFCHSGDIVQGGFITAMLDATMSQAVFAFHPGVVGLSSLEISTRYLEVTRAGPLKALGRIVRLSHKTAFLDGQLLGESDQLLATAQTVAKLKRREA